MTTGKRAERTKHDLPVLNLPLCHWSSQLFDLRAPSSTDVPVLLLNQPIVGFNRGRQHPLIKTCRTQSKRSDQQLSDYCQTNDKLALYLSVNVFSTKVLIGDIIFTPSTGDGATIQFVIRATRRSSRLQ